MRSRIRQFLTVLFLLAFSMENLAAIAIPFEAGKFTTQSKIEVQKEKLGTSFLFEVNEGTDDDKIHGLAIVHPVYIPTFDNAFVFKIKPDFHRSVDSRHHQHVLQLICRLTI